ncbi:MULTISPECIES: alpha/beta fold hydrolase [Mycobacterium]|uniref:3-oxoadipate enol-lactonase n=1 Tax=Mycobacterium kiyosense TaxID=2871094 RepID=A0A9P3Q911_9MYCO|nr:MULTISPECIES: alpha/beta hydrolase [Mycobacterium]BDB43867.1 3-oxoadipate enol-lactonase [Mycobacterium kiyosense]BDE15423.1 3-oxoadipate enol-lactonase [Mycobacterium sp. 20KCMC460]GLB82689.1 3-oxoadipate enol-lactonase [Mycobacterium kiyosense]GLB90152.1 3-oxoadipate enol-lactonase [Mycobacterium kiyosense]GLB95741.1 3-oxoadipate enol-lactonase [Mycobacterium kiyosense]
MTAHVDVEIGGYRVRILVDGGTGPVVVLCSGLGGRALHWTDTVEYLKNDHTVVRFDRPGTAQTPAVTWRPTLRGEADRIAAVLDALRRPEPAIVVGHSVGGFYAEGFARLHPQRARALLLLDSSIAYDKPRIPLRPKLAAVEAAARLLDTAHLQGPLARAAITLVQRRRPDGLDSQTRSQVHSAAAEPGLAHTVLAEYVAYPELGAELCALRAAHPLPPLRCVVATAHTGWRSRGWRNRQIRLARSLGAQHVTIAPAGHLVMVEQPLRTAGLIRALTT